MAAKMSIGKTLMANGSTQYLQTVLHSDCGTVKLQELDGEPTSVQTVSITAPRRSKDLSRRRTEENYVRHYMLSVWQLSTQ